MTQRTITKSEFDEMMVPLMALAGIHEKPEVSPIKFHVPLTRTTSVKVEFVGPVGIDEYDSLLAHVAFYKLLVPQDGEPKLGERDFVGQLRSIVDKIWLTPPSPEVA